MATRERNNYDDVRSHHPIENARQSINFKSDDIVLILYSSALPGTVACIIFFIPLPNMAWPFFPYYLVQRKII